MSDSFSPLASRVRPNNLSEFVGQEELVGPKSWLASVISNDHLPSLIFWGPPGSGKTTLALIIAKETKANFVQLSAVESGIKDLRVILDRAREDRRLGAKTILFIDEIHRWNKAQQDALLPQVENGTISLIGATTENPSFSVNGALLSRAKVLVLKILSDQEIIKILEQALEKDGSGKLKAGKIDAEALKLISSLAGGDARRALNILEDLISFASGNKKITEELIKKIALRPMLSHDRTGDDRYDLISALHKTMRGGDANAAIYYLARLLEAGEDPLYVARRMIRFASEDIGIANNSALLLANAVYDTCQKIGLPECKVNLAHAAVYLAKSPKSIVAYFGYNKAAEMVVRKGSLPVPLHIRNAPTKLMKNLGYGEGYKYTPLDGKTDLDYLPEEIKNEKFI
ncbi:MAG: replication-associated recombination protein A [Candidatus Falkowbacteria bacterium]|nr:replication-associated recombination protein A [Candidatus Falkowbacteria bacterium]